MDKDFNLDKVGKRMPYTTPEGFLDQLETNVWQEVKADMKMHQTKPRRKLYRLSIVSTLLAAVLMIHPFAPKQSTTPTDSFAPVEQAYAQLSPDDQAYMLEVYQDDVFLNEQQQ